MSTDSLAKSLEEPERYLQFQKGRKLETREKFSMLAEVGAAKFCELILPFLYDNDVICDFGGSIGYASEAIEQLAYIRPIVVDINDDVTRKAAAKGFPTRTCSLESLNFKDGEVDWGFCSHVIEHVLDLDKAADELTRVIKRGLFLIFPLESKEAFDKNPEHMRHSEGPDLFLDPFIKRGWKVGYENRAQFEGFVNFQAWLYR